MSSADDQTTTVSSELRADIRRLGDLLGETLVRQEGPELLELVERVRRLTREDGEAAADLLRGTELETAAKLVRAFSTYFHLANVTEQVHRGRELRARRAAEGGLLARTARETGRAVVMVEGVKNGVQVGAFDLFDFPVDPSAKLMTGTRVVEKVGGDSLSEMVDHLEATRGRWREFLSRRPRAAT